MGSASLYMLLCGIISILRVGPSGHRITSQGEAAGNAFQSEREKKREGEISKPYRRSNHQRFNAKSSGADASSKKHIPSDFRVFQNAFHNLMQSDPNLQKPLNPGKHTLWMGVPVRPERADARMTIRESWMSQPGVCKITAGSREADADKSCALYTSFVLGGISDSTGLPSDCVGGKDCMFVQEEGVYVTKVLAFFRKALNEFPWATHVGKIDTDTFPFFYQLLPQMLDGQYSLIGYMMGNAECGGRDDICPPAGCGKSVGGNLLQYNGASGKTCWSYPSGALFVLSRSLALGAFDEEIQSALPFVDGYDDVMVGWAAHEYARRKNAEVQTFTEEVAANELSKMFVHQPWAYAHSD